MKIFVPQNSNNDNKDIFKMIISAVKQNGCNVLFRPSDSCKIPSGDGCYLPVDWHKGIIYVKPDKETFYIFSAEIIGSRPDGCLLVNKIMETYKHSRAFSPNNLYELSEIKIQCGKRTKQEIYALNFR